MYVCMYVCTTNTHAQAVLEEGVRRQRELEAVAAEQLSQLQRCVEAEQSAADLRLRRSEVEAVWNM